MTDLSTIDNFMDNIDYSEKESMILLSGHVVYDPLKRTLSREKKSLTFQKMNHAFLNYY